MGSAVFQSFLFYGGGGGAIDLETTLEDLASDVANTENLEFTIDENLYNTTFAPSGVLFGQYKGTVQIGGKDFVAVLQLGGDYYLLSTEPAATAGFPATFTGAGINAVTFPACFASGTMIETPDGSTVVEALEVGDEIRTADGRVASVKWVGRQRLWPFKHGGRMQPVCIRAGALGGGLPYCDLTVTADHGMVIDGYVINASALVNGETIDWVPMAELEDSFTVYHVETEAHDVILANGAPAETFIDYAGRSVFDNYDEYLALYGADWMIREMHLPRISSARLVPQGIRERLELNFVPNMGLRSSA